MMFEVDNELKTAYLDYISNEYKEGSFATQKKVLQGIDDAEVSLNSKVYNFSKESMMFLLSSFDTSVSTTLVCYKSVILQYLTYVSTGRSATGITTIKDITVEDLRTITNYHGFASAHVTKSEYLDMLERGYDKLNGQDVVMFVLLWNGVRGTKYVDLIHFKKDNYNSELGTLAVNDNIIKLEDIEKKCIDKALSETRYVVYEPKELKYKNFIDKKTGEVVRRCTTRRPVIKDYVLDISKSEYIVNPIRKNTGVESEYYVKVRLTTAFRYLGNPYMTGVSIYTSGAMYKMFEENGFSDMRYKDMCIWLDKHNFNTSRSKLKELKEVYVKKFTAEGIYNK